MMLSRILAVSALLGLVAPPPARGQQITLSSAAFSLPPDRKAVLEQSANLRVADVPLAAALIELQERSRVPLLYSPSLLPEDRVSCDCLTATVRAALDRLLAETSFCYTDLGDQVLIESRQPASDWRSPSPPPSTRLAANRSRAVPNEPTCSRAADGTVAGQITDARSGQPVVGAQVYIAGTRIGGLTNAAGRYSVARVPEGGVRVRVQMLGYAVAEKGAVVRADQVTRVDFQLTQQALALDELIVTGTAGGTQRRAIGNSVDRLDASALARASAAAVNVEQMLSTRSAGAHVLPSPGIVGTGTAIRIRGLSSLTLGHQPLIYVDGIRVDNRTNAGPPLRQGRQVSRFNDFNPDDIESIEIIKGPAAATLYGTEASAGVIQIITKKGAVGAAELEFSIRQGVTYMPDPAGRLSPGYYYNPQTGVTDSVNFYQREADMGNRIFQYGLMQTYGGSVRGGSDLVRYYASVEWDDQKGIVDYNWQKKFSTRLNLSVVPSERWDLNANLGFIRSHTRFAQAAPGLGIWDFLSLARPVPSALAGPQRGFLYAPPEVGGLVDSRSVVGRITGSSQLTHRPVKWLQHRLKVGFDYVDELNTQLFPRVPEGEVNFFGARGVGEKLAETRDGLNGTVDYSATASFDLTPRISSATSVGMQYYAQQSTSTSALGRNFASTAVTTVGAASITQGSESFQENKTAGVYVQQQLGWNGRLFLTSALRADDNSAFGADFDVAVYPKLSGTWAISEEPFWNLEWVSKLLIRSAWGRAGRQPGALDAVTLYAAETGPGGAAVLTPKSLGNPTIRPEVGEELEVGFDAAFLQDRLSLSFTRFDRVTTDALVRRPNRPYAGFPGGMMANLGKIKSWGSEIAANAVVLDGEQFGWDFGVTFAPHKNRIEDLGDVEPLPGEGQRNIVGYPIASLFVRRVLSAEFVGKTTSITKVMCDGGTGPYGMDQGGDPVPCADAPRVYWGQPEPTWTGNVNTTLRIGGGLRFGGLVEFRGGHQYVSGDINIGHTSSQHSRAVNPVTDPILQAYRTIVERSPSGIFDAGFARLREVSFSYTLPERWVAAVGSSRASIAAAWRNAAFLWREQKTVWGSKVFDPETISPGDVTVMRFQTTMPPTAQFITTLRFSF